jgi:small subunit ribosomal protein S20
MANIPSVIKRNRQSQKKRIRNQAARTKIKGAVKAVRELAAGSTAAEKQAALGNAMRTLQKAAGKGVLHSRTAARKISRLAKGLTKAS